jgi:hypothetical protein
MELFLVLGALVIGGTVGGLGVGIISGSFASRSCDDCGRAIDVLPREARPVPARQGRTPWTNRGPF